jgi:hypothetical protein
MRGTGKTLRGVERAYAGEADRPLGGYAVALASYAGFVGALVGIGSLRSKRLPGKVGIGDAALLSVATHKLSRLIAKDAVFSPVRAAFTRYEEPAGEGEVNESVRGHGARHVVGEMISCPFCLAAWISTGLVGGLVLAPRVTRTFELIMSAVAASDALQLVYDAAKDGIRAP